MEQREPVGQSYLSGYKLYRKDIEGPTRGDVTLHVKEGIESNKLEIPQNADPSTGVIFGPKNNLVLRTFCCCPDQIAQGHTERKNEFKEASKIGIVVMDDFCYSHIDI